ncbi:MAG: hypothetical protein L3J79_08700, partial [Candidatus Marinimicrobia bacterium]|nr:hypothetical protein [Candidatus Neomarinimicrobiota bacterium]
MKQTQQENGQLGGFFQGDLLYVTLNGGQTSTEVTGQIQLYFNENDSNQEARMQLDLDFDGGIFSQSGIPDTDQPFTMNGAYLEYEIENFEVGNDIGTTGNDADHYSGAWEHYENGVLDHKQTILSWIEKDFEVMTIASYDTNGKPVWLHANSCYDKDNTANGCQRPHEGDFSDYVKDTANNNTFLVMKEGFNPIGGKPLDYDFEGAKTYIGKGGRNFIAETGYKEANFWLNVPTSDVLSGRTIDISLGNSANQKYMRKWASLHDIRFFVNGADEPETTCDPNDPTGPSECVIKFIWYTDDDYAPVPYFSLDGDPLFQPLQTLCGPVPTGYVVTGFECTIPAEGDYRFQLHKDKYVGGGTEVIAEYDQVLTIVGYTSANCEPTTLPPAEPPAIHTLTQNSSSSKVGVTSGTLNVDMSGSASYSLPIYTPTGTGGMKPDLSLVYNSSDTANNIAGVGWSIGGVSSIGRCLKNVEQDNITQEQHQPISLSNEDAFCLDGQKLKLLSGANGTDNAQYRTELESFSKITVVGVQDSGPAKFEVRLKNGEIREYGSSSANHNAQIKADGTNKVITWLLNKISDRHGNEIWYVWDN